MRRVLLVLLLVTVPAGAVFAAPAAETLQKARRAALDGRWTVAQQGFAQLLRNDVRSPGLHFLNAFAYEELGRRSDPAFTDLARVGYENAIAFDSGHFWAQVQLGYLALEKGAAVEAQQHFASAVKVRPDRWEPLYGLGAASYQAGDLDVAALAAGRAAELAPRQPDVLRLRALVLAARGDGTGANQALQDYRAIDGKDRFLARRVPELLRTATIAVDDDPGAMPAVAVDPAAINQITVDLTLILSSVVKIENRGINLFDGLNLQYGYSNAWQAARASGGDWSSNRTIAQTISVPTLNYNLNLFNDSGQNYQVLARPTLTAYMGRESEFFAGRTINVGVSGVNLGSLQPIDVGVGLKVTPERIDGDVVTFRVSATRSFLSREQVQGFDESLTTFKQLVSATAEVPLGQTLLLSALSEAVQDDASSKVPVLGSIPGPGLLFSQKSKLNRRESLIVLLTPTLPTAIPTAASPARRAAEVQSLIDLWSTVVDPTSSVEVVSATLQRSRFFRGAKAGDVRVRGITGEALRKEALEESFASVLQ